MPEAKTSKTDTREGPYSVESAGSKNAEVVEGSGSLQAVDPIKAHTQQIATTVPDEHNALTPPKDDLDGFAGVVSNSVEGCGNSENVPGTSTSVEAALNLYESAVQHSSTLDPNSDTDEDADEYGDIDGDTDMHGDVDDIEPDEEAGMYDIDAIDDEAEMYGQPNIFDGMSSDDVAAKMAGIFRYYGY